MIGVLTSLLEDRGPQAIGELTAEPHLTAELVTGGVFSVIRQRIGELEADGAPLVSLAPSLMAFIVRPYLGQAVASAELAGDGADTAEARARGGESIVAPPVPVSQRTTLVLSAIGRAPRSSNREIAAAAGLGDEGQTSHLLRRLAQRGLIEKVRPRSGSRRENAWLLTPCGRDLIELLVAAGAARPRASEKASVGKAA